VFRLIDASTARGSSPAGRHRPGSWLIAAGFVTLAASPLIAASPSPGPSGATDTLHGVVPPAVVLGITEVGPNISPTLAAIATDGISVWVGDASGVARIEAATGRVTGRVSVGANGNVAADEDHVWISSYSSGAVAPLTPTRDTVDTTRQLAVDAPAGMAIGLGSVWVTTPDKHLVTRIDAATGELLALIPLNVVGPIVAGFDAMWATTEGGHGVAGSEGLARIDPATNTSQPVDLELLGGSVGSALAIGDDALWVGLSDSRLRRVDPVTLDVTKATGRARPSLSGPILGMAVAGNELWLLGSMISGWYVDYLHSPGTLVRVDTSTLEVLDTWQVSSGANGAVLVNDQLWSAVGFSTVERYGIGADAEPGEDQVAPHDPGSIVFDPAVMYSAVDDDLAIPLDVLAAPKASGAPVVLLVPGGPLEFDNRRYMAGLAASLAVAGAVVFEIDYRSEATGDREGDALRDLACAIGWARDNAQRYGGDPQHVVVAGHSYGGYLAILEVASAAGATGCDGQVELPDGVVAIAGWPETSAIAPTTTERMPVNLLVGTEDENLESSSEVQQALEGSGFESELELVTGADHGAVIDGRSTVPTVQFILDTAVAATGG
jgi:acetyl esterase/lipase